MTTPTPTSNPALPGLPDLATLNRLAGEFFASLPGQSTGNPGVAGLIAPVPDLQPTQPAQPELAPVAAVAPDSAAPSAPTLAGGAAPSQDGASSVSPRTGLGDAQAITVPVNYPPEYAPALPHAAPVSTSALPGPSTPYYFLGESSAYGGSPFTAAPQESSPGVPGSDLLARSFGLPGEDALREILAPSSAPAPKADGAGAASQFYFVDTLSTAPQGLPRDPALVGAHPPFDVHAIRRDFPILAERVRGKPLVWFDNAATTQKPQAVIDRLAWFYAHENSNIHRAAHELAARATDAYEAARDKVARFLGAGSPQEIVFVRGATEAINLVAQSWGRQHIGEGDEILVSILEHHANIVPWQQLAREKGAVLRVIPVDDSGQILLDEYRRLLTPRTRLVAVTQVSNALGTITPVKEMVDMAHAVGARILVDGAQAVSHLRVNLKALDTDFYVFSGHKVFGPTGIGVVYGKRDLLEATQPWQGGGNMIADVTFERTVYQSAPARFEAGTGNIADAVGLGAALDYLDRIGLENVAHYEHGLLEYATAGLRTIPGLRLVGTAREKTSVASFVLDGYRTEEVGQALSEEGIAVRSGHHCAQPILRRFGLEATVRPSFAFYNTCEEVDHLITTLRRLKARTRG